MLGMTVACFCAADGVSVSAFYLGRRKLGAIGIFNSSCDRNWTGSKVANNLASLAVTGSSLAIKERTRSKWANLPDGKSKEEAWTGIAEDNMGVPMPFLHLQQLGLTMNKRVSKRSGGEPAEFAAAFYTIRTGSCCPLITQSIKSRLEIRFYRPAAPVIDVL